MSSSQQIKHALHLRGLAYVFSRGGLDSFTCLDSGLCAHFAGTVSLRAQSAHIRRGPPCQEETSFRRGKTRSEYCPSPAGPEVAQVTVGQIKQLPGGDRYLIPAKPGTRANFDTPKSTSVGRLAEIPGGIRLDHATTLK